MIIYKDDSLMSIKDDYRYIFIYSSSPLGKKYNLALTQELSRSYHIYHYVS